MPITQPMVTTMGIYLPSIDVFLIHLGQGCMLSLTALSIGSLAPLMYSVVKVLSTDTVCDDPIIQKILAIRMTTTITISDDLSDVRPTATAPKPLTTRNKLVLLFNKLSSCSILARQRSQSVILFFLVFIYISYNTC